ncbi:MAG: hypothetical protein FJ009_21640 [Chloroflexi bacterium]|nr:hypothetical protein [Chloroflexota bacterium]
MAYQIHLPSHLQATHGDNGGLNRDSKIAALCAERDRLRARWEKGLDFLDALRERTGQDTPEFDRYFAEWERIDAELRAVLDRIAFAEMTARIREQSTVNGER